MRDRSHSVTTGTANGRGTAVQNLIAEDDDERIPLWDGGKASRVETRKPEHRGSQVGTDTHGADSLAGRKGRERRPTSGRGPACVRTGLRSAVDTPLLGVAMRITESRGDLSPHASKAQPEMGGLCCDPERFVTYPCYWG